MNAGSQTLFLRFFPIKKRPNCQKRTFGSSAVFFGKTRRFPSPPHEGFSFDYGSLTCHIVKRYPPDFGCQLIIFYRETALFRHGGVNSQACLCSVSLYVSTQPIDFLGTMGNSSFPI